METIDYKGYKIKVITDEDPSNPRDDSDPLGRMVCFHRRYNLGDKHDFKSQDFHSWDELIAAVIKEEGPIIYLRLYLYDHSGITMNCSGYRGIDSQGWDWGPVGFIYISKKKARKEYGWKQITKAREEQIIKYLEGEVKIYDDYLTGAVYGYEICRPGEEESCDSCGGYYGYDHEESGLLGDARNAVDCDIQWRLKNEGIQETLLQEVSHE